MENVWVDEVVPQCLHRKRRVFPGQGIEESIMIVPWARPGELPFVEGTVGVRTELWPADFTSGERSSAVMEHVYLPAERYIE